MISSKRTLIYIGNVYRLRKESAAEGIQYPLEALIDNRWKEVQCWSDVGYVAGQLVRHGITADHAAALHLLNAA